MTLHVDNELTHSPLAQERQSEHLSHGQTDISADRGLGCCWAEKEQREMKISWVIKQSAGNRIVVFKLVVSYGRLTITHRCRRQEPGS